MYKFIISILLCNFFSISFAETRLFQYSTFTGLTSGIYQGNYPISKLKQQGNFGIGAFNNLAGEMIAIDGNFYQFGYHGETQQVTNDREEVPFAIMTSFSQPLQITASNMEEIAFLSLLSQHIKYKQKPYAFKIEGTFNEVLVRNFKEQTQPFPAFDEVVEAQLELQLNNVEGILIGFWFPDYLGQINIPAFHFHFIDKDKQLGGHVLNFSIENVEVTLESIAETTIRIPSTKNVNDNT